MATFLSRPEGRSSHREAHLPPAWSDGRSGTFRLQYTPPFRTPPDQPTYKVMLTWLMQPAETPSATVAAVILGVTGTLRMRSSAPGGSFRDGHVIEGSRIPLVVLKLFTKPIPSLAWQADRVAVRLEARPGGARPASELPGAALLRVGWR